MSEYSRRTDHVGLDNMRNKRADSSEDISMRKKLDLYPGTSTPWISVTAEPWDGDGTMEPRSRRSGKGSARACLERLESLPAFAIVIGGAQFARIGIGQSALLPLLLALLERQGRV